MSFTLVHARIHFRYESTRVDSMKNIALFLWPFRNSLLMQFSTIIKKDLYSCNLKTFTSHKYSSKSFTFSSLQLLLLTFFYVGNRSFAIMQRMHYTSKS